MRIFSSGKVDYNPRGLVLEIGAGLSPAPESDVCLDTDPGRIEKIEKDGFLGVVGDGLKLPFKDSSFDYVTCMHLVEHLDTHEIAQFFDEIQRVAPRGYLEVPSIYWELLHNCDKAFFPSDNLYEPHHRQYCFYHDQTLHLIKKSDEYNVSHKILRELFRNIINKPLVSDNIDLFMIGFEWQGNVKYQLHDSLSDIPDDLLDVMVQTIMDYANRKKQIPRTKMVFDKLSKIMADRFKSMLPRSFSKPRKTKDIDLSKLLK